ncbi:MAG: exodeoxyribonuclease III [Acidimicrobiales bacterium]|nr:exodeoxyribonuclease III [Acidimicrobiales bacterium]
MRIVTWNVNSLKARLPRVEEWLGQVEPDVVCLQETKMADPAFPALTFQALGYEAAHHGEGRWNGVAILSKVGLEDVAYGFGGDDPELDGEARLLTATCGGVRVSSIYVPNGREVGHDHYHYKLAWLAELRRFLDRDGATGASGNRVLCGDFNIAPDDRDVYDPAAFVGATHVSAPERAALAELEAWGLSDVFRRHYDDGGLYSWWDYRAGNFHKGKGMRIDLVLASASLAQRSTAALIDRNARKGKAPSDHAPVVADFAPGGAA